MWFLLFKVPSSIYTITKHCINKTLDACVFSREWKVSFFISDAFQLERAKRKMNNLHLILEACHRAEENRSNIHFGLRPLALRLVSATIRSFCQELSVFPLPSSFHINKKYPKTTFSTLLDCDAAKVPTEALWSLGLTENILFQSMP